MKKIIYIIIILILLFLIGYETLNLLGVSLFHQSTNTGLGFCK